MTNSTHAKKFIEKQKPKLCRLANLSRLLHLASVEDRHVRFSLQNYIQNAAPCQAGAYADTDSSVYHIQIPDLYKDMAENVDAYDTYCYPVDFKKNAKLIGMMKNECYDQLPQEFAGLYSQMYSICLPRNKVKFTAKGVSRKYILKHL